MQNKPVVLFLTFFLLSSVVAQGQKLVNSPYARFNIGALNPQGSFRSLAMGGTGIGIRDNSTIYFNNPASYSSIDTVSFLFDFGLDFGMNKLSDGTNKYSSKDMNFNHLLLGFPISKGFGFAAGLVPVSNGYYYLSQKISEGDPGYDPIIGEVINIHRGTGSITKLFAGTGINLTKHLSAGINLDVLFGQISRTNQFEFGDFYNTFSESGVENLKINGINLDYGLQYFSSFKKDHFLIAGFSVIAAKKYHSSREILEKRFSAYVSSTYSPDTLVYSNYTSSDSTLLPASYRFGISFGKKDKFTAGIDYIFTRWSKARIQGQDASTMSSTASLLFGLEYIPEKYSNTSVLKRIEYCLGGHIATNYLAINGEQIKEYGFSAGLGIRLRNISPSKATFFFDYTSRRGDTSKGLHIENIYSFGASLNLYDFWFLKRKYD
jgi:hypothetical protein